MSDEKLHPIEIGCFSAEAVVQVANPLTHLVKEAHRIQERTAVFHSFPRLDFYPDIAYKARLQVAFKGDWMTRISSAGHFIEPVFLHVLRHIYEEQP